MGFEIVKLFWTYPGLKLDPLPLIIPIHCWVKSEFYCLGPRGIRTCNIPTTQHRSLRGVVVKLLALHTRGCVFDHQLLPVILMRHLTEVPSLYDISCWWDI